MASEEAITGEVGVETANSAVADETLIEADQGDRGPLVSEARLEKQIHTCHEEVAGGTKFAAGLRRQDPPSAPRPGRCRGLLLHAAVDLLVLHAHHPAAENGPQPDLLLPIGVETVIEAVVAGREEDAAQTIAAADGRIQHPTPDRPLPPLEGGDDLRQIPGVAPHHQSHAGDAIAALYPVHAHAPHL